MSDLLITNDGKLALTDQELGVMQAMLNAHDRTAFYMVYHLMTGSKEAALQASAALVPAALFSRPQSDRTSLRQNQALDAPGSEANHR